MLATNRPGDLDAAILDRMDEALEFGLPGIAERQRILALYLDQYIFKAGTAEGGAGSGSSVGLWARLSVSSLLLSPPVVSPLRVADHSRDCSVHICRLSCLALTLVFCLCNVQHESASYIQRFTGNETVLQRSIIAMTCYLLGSCGMCVAVANASVPVCCLPFK